MSDTPKPPYVQFETRPVEDREASEQAGHVVYRDVIFAIVTPAGTRDRLEKVAEEWLANLEEGVRQERIPAEWPEGYRRKLDLFKSNQEIPLDGTALSLMTTLTPAQVKNCLNANILTVEDLASATEEAMTRIGMGGRDLKQKAQAWLDAVDSKGKPAQELNELRVKNKTYEAQIASHEETIKKLQAQVSALEALTKKEEA